MDRAQFILAGGIGLFGLGRAKTPPRIDSFTPTRGDPGTLVTINGQYLGATSRVTFAGTPAAFDVRSPQRITATVPQGASDGYIVATAKAGTARSPAPFDVTTAEPPPVGNYTAGAVERVA